MTPAEIKAVTDLLNRYAELINSGDCGFWDVEKLDEVIAVRAVLAEAALPAEDSADEKPVDLVLLKVDPASHPLYFVVRWPRLAEPDQQKLDTYFFEEHTCPSNWTGDIVGVIAAGDPDPHGFVEFVRRTPEPADMYESGDALWPQLFPEVSGPTGDIPHPTLAKSP